MIGSGDQRRGPDGPGRSGGRIGPEELRALWHAHRRWVAAILLSHKPREVELEDLLQDVAMKLVRHANELEDPARVRPWLRTVAVNVARTSGRRTKVRRSAFAPMGPDMERPSEGSESAERAAAREEGMRALEAARGLPPEYREPLILRAVRGMSYRQIADVLGIPITTIETRLSRARRMVREALEREAQRAVAGRIGGTSADEERV